MFVSQIVKWNQFVRDGKFTAQSSKRQRIPKERSKMDTQRNWQHRVHKTQDKQNKKHNTICVGHHYKQTHTHSVKKK